MRTASRLSVLFVIFLAGISAVCQAPAADATYDTIAQDVLQKTGVPSASLAVVRDGKIVYLHAYGDAKLDPKTPAQTGMRYSIGSISKQFTATAMLMLQEQGKLSLDDKVGKYVPDLTRANEVTIRQLLSHTSGYQDDWPQDYVMPEMLQPTTVQHILDKWAKIPLDFDPGTKWQYSNTNYAIAGVIIQKVSGMPVTELLKQRVFTPLGMKSVLDIDQDRLTESDATGYMRYALGPLHPAPKEGRGWLYAMGELAMTAEDLAKWDISLINQAVLKPESYRQMETEAVLKNGVGTGYGLGVQVGSQRSHRFVNHSGEVSGFTAQNMVFPDDKAAVVVLTNQDAIGAGGQIAGRIAATFFQTPQGAPTRETDEARQVFADLQQGKIDRSLFTSNCNAYFNQTALHDYATTLGPLGEVQEFVLEGESLRGGMIHRNYRAKLATKTVSVNSFWMPDGKIEQFIVTGQN